MGSQMLLESPSQMGRKRTEKETVMVRTYKDFAEKLKRAAGERGLSAADFCDKILMGCVEKAHRDYIKDESQRIEGEEE